MSVLQTQLNSRSADFLANATALQAVVDDLRVQLKKSAERLLSWVCRTDMFEIS